MIAESGISGMRFTISETAKWGDVSKGPRIINQQSRRTMKALLRDIQSGKFAREWVKEYETGLKNYNALLKAGDDHLIEKTGQRLRSLMPWVKKKNIKGAQAAY